MNKYFRIKLTMKNILFSLIAFVALSFTSFAANDYPYAAAGPAGIYVFCGSAIPRDFAYKIYRAEGAGKDYSLIKILAFNPNYNDFYDNINLINAKNPIFDLPQESLKDSLWQWANSINDADRIPFFGGIPMYKEALKVAYYDNSAKKGVAYSYKVVVSAGDSEKTVDLPQISYSGERAQFKLKSLYSRVNDDCISLKFFVMRRGSFYKAKILKRAYLQTDFEECDAQVGMFTHNDSLFVNVKDTSVLKKIIYEYCAIPYDIYGNPGSPSDTVKITNIIDVAESYIGALHTESVENANAIKLTWALKEPEYLRSIDIYKSEVYDGNYRYYASAGRGDTVFIDKIVDPIKTYFYYLIINNAYGQSKPSARIAGMLKANKKAEAPTRVLAASKPGTVELTWNKPSGDTRGYYIFKSEGGIEDMIQIGDLFKSDSLNPIFIDTLKNVKYPTGAYCVKSMNSSYDISPASDTVYADMHYDIKLATPMQAQAKYSDDRVLLVWSDEKGGDLNISGYNVYKKALKKDGSDSSAFVLINDKFNIIGDNYYIDSAVSQGVTYQYAVQSIGGVNLKSEISAPAKVEIPVFKPIAISDLKAVKSDNAVVLNWEPTRQSSVKGYKIYRLINNAQPQLIITLDKDKSEYIDSAAPQGESCFYAVACVNDKNIESDITDWVGVSK